MLNNYSIITKKESFDILKRYFKKFKTDDLYYYLNTNDNDISDFLDNNIIEVDVEYLMFGALIYSHLKIVIDKCDYKLNNNLIKISFITDLIYWEDIFVIESTIFINYSYIKRIHKNIKNKSYNSVKEIYLDNKNIYDINLLELLNKSLLYIYQFYNLDIIVKEFKQDNFFLIDKIKIKNISEKEILLNPNISFLHDKVVIYKLNQKYYCSLNIVISNKKSYSPYYEDKIYELEYKDGYYYLEENSLDINLYSEPLINIVNNITNNLFL